MQELIGFCKERNGLGNPHELSPQLFNCGFLSQEVLFILMYPKPGAGFPVYKCSIMVS